MPGDANTQEQNGRKAGTTGGDRLPSAYRTLTVFALVAAAVLLGFLGILIQNGVMTKDNAASVSAMVVALIGVFGFLFKFVLDEIARRETLRVKKHGLAVALHAEILSNLQQQRRASRPKNVAATMEKKFLADSERPRVLRSGSRWLPHGSQKETAGKSISLSDRSNAIFDKAVDNYDFIPALAIEKIIAYYNLNGMLNDLNELIGTDAFMVLAPEKRKTVVREYFELLIEVDRSGCEAIKLLKLYTGQYGGDGTGDESPLSELDEFRLVFTKTHMAALEAVDFRGPATVVLDPESSGPEVVTTGSVSSANPAVG